MTYFLLSGENESRKLALFFIVDPLQASSDPFIVAVRYVYTVFALRTYFYLSFFIGGLHENVVVALIN